MTEHPLDGFQSCRNSPVWPCKWVYTKPPSFRLFRAPPLKVPACIGYFSFVSFAAVSPSCLVFRLPGSLSASCVFRLRSLFLFTPPATLRFFRLHRSQYRRPADVGRPFGDGEDWAVKETLMCLMGLAPPVTCEAPLLGFFAGGSSGIFLAARGGVLLASLQESRAPSSDRLTGAPKARHMRKTPETPRLAA